MTRIHIVRRQQERWYSYGTTTPPGLRPRSCKCGWRSRPPSTLRMERTCSAALPLRDGFTIIYYRVTKVVSERSFKKILLICALLLSFFLCLHIYFVNGEMGSFLSISSFVISLAFERTIRSSLDVNGERLLMCSSDTRYSINGSATLAAIIIICFVFDGVH